MENKLFFNHQYSFHSGHSTELAALELTDTIITALDNHHTPLNIFLDLSKALYTLDQGRDFRRGNYEEIRKSLALIDGNDKMNNKMATECWNILRGELDSAIDRYVLMKKQGKRSKKKHLSKEAF